MIPKTFLYCWWILAWTILYLLNITNISPLISSFFGTLTSFYIQFLSKYRNKFKFNFKIFIIVAEIFILSILFYKTDLSNFKRDLIYNLVIFILYLIVLSFYNKTFYQIYFIDLINEHKKPFSVRNYLKKRFYII